MTRLRSVTELAKLVDDAGVKRKAAEAAWRKALDAVCARVEADPAINVSALARELDLNRNTLIEALARRQQTRDTLTERTTA